MAERLGVRVTWRPILVGGVFNTVNRQIYAARESLFSDPANRRKLDYYLKDLQDWAALCGVTAILPEKHPISSVRAMRGAFFAEEQGLLVPYSRAVFEAYWGGRTPDIASDEVLAAICRQVGLEPEAFFEAIAGQHCKDRLRENTDELIARGGFGSPTVFVDGDDMYFGNDRLPLVEHRLQQSIRAG
jgi:2-hydroxychromene-2-carboxylate isomerase